jgi:hypothetical protein
MIINFAPNTNMSESHRAYEASSEFQTYWTAQCEADRLHELANFSNVKSQEFQNYKVARDEASRLLAVARAIPIHKEAFGW